MKKLFLIPVTLFAFAVYAQPKPKPKVHNQSKVKELPDSSVVYQTTKYKDNVDDRMKGPNGEKVYIGPNGGRYYLRGTQKVYVPYKANKKPS